MTKEKLNEIKERVYNNSLNTCEFISGDARVGGIVLLRCLVHDHLFKMKWDAIRKGTNPHHVCPICKQEDIISKKHFVSCDYCGKKYSLPKNKLLSYDFHFCSRACKDSAQRINSGEKFNALRPDHYGQVKTKYREVAFRNFSHKCLACGWDEDTDILEVHHIDEDRSNNSLENLVILCPTCHRKLTSHKYILVENQIIKTK